MTKKYIYIYTFFLLVYKFTQDENLAIHGVKKTEIYKIRTIISGIKKKTNDVKIGTWNTAAIR